MPDRLTEIVSMWIANDGDHYGEALELAEEVKTGGRGEVETFQDHLIDILLTAPDESTASYVLRDILAQVDWREVATDLASE